MTISYINFLNNQHIVLENFFTPEFILEIYQDIQKSRYIEKFSENILDYIQRDHNVIGNYNYVIEPKYISNYANLEKIIETFNTMIKLNQLKILLKIKVIVKPYLVNIIKSM